MKNTEILNILKEEIQNTKKDTQLIEIGEVIKINDGIATIYGINDVKYNELVQFESKILGIVFEIKEDSVEVIILGDSTTISEGNEVKRLYKTFTCPVGETLLGRVIDTLGNPVDGKGPIQTTKQAEVDAQAPNIMSRKTINEPMYTGIKVIDTLIPIGKGQRELLIGDRKTGKTSIAIDTIIHQKYINKKEKQVYCIYVAIGQKKSSVAKLIKKLEEENAMEYSIIIVAGASDPVALQFYAPYVGCTIGEYFRDNAMDALIIYDDLSKHAISYRQISLLLRRPPGREAYPGDIFYIHSKLLERAAKLSNTYGGGSLTALPIIETQEGDLSTYIPTNIISITDGQIFLENSLFLKGIKPAINIGLSVSRVGSSAQINAMKKISGRIKLNLAQFRELESFSQFTSELDKDTKEIITQGHKMIEILKQAVHSTMCIEDQIIVIFTATQGFLLDIEDNDIKNFERELLTFIKNKSPEILEQIKNTKDLSKEITIKITKCIKNFKNSFLS